jgi:hypothetical protein
VSPSTKLTQLAQAENKAPTLLKGKAGKKARNRANKRAAGAKEEQEESSWEAKQKKVDALDWA